MSRLLKYIAKYDENLTIAQLKEAIKQEDISAKQTEIEKINKVKEDFKDTYLKRITNCDIFGKSLEVYHTEEITGYAEDTGCNLYYFITGCKIVFSLHDINHRKLQQNTTDTFYENELRDMTPLTEDEYDYYKVKYDGISEQLNNLIEL